MIYVYIGITILSAVLLTADMILRYIEKIPRFGLEKVFFQFRGKTIPWEEFLPRNITLLFAYIHVTGWTGIALTLLRMRWYFSLPCALLMGCFACFFFQHFFLSARAKYHQQTAPTGTDASGIEGFAAEEIPANFYGTIEFTYNGVVFLRNAISVNGTDIEQFERVVIVLEEDGMYMVESIREVYQGYDELEE